MPEIQLTRIIHETVGWVEQTSVMRGSALAETGAETTHREIVFNWFALTHEQVSEFDPPYMNYAGKGDESVFHGMKASAPMESSNRTINWRVHPFRERAGAACFAVVIVLALACLSASLMQSFWWGVLALLILTAALNRFFFPSEYNLDDQGITVRSMLKSSRVRWEEIRRFLHDDRGGYLSSRARSSFFDAFRGVHLLFAENRDLVIERIHGYLEREGKAA